MGQPFSLGSQTAWGGASPGKGGPQPPQPPHEGIFRASPKAGAFGLARAAPSQSFAEVTVATSRPTLAPGPIKGAPLPLARHLLSDLVF